MKQKIPIHIREATPQDVSQIFELIKELATFEKCPECVTNTPESLLKDGFSDSKAFICFVAETESSVVGMALCYTRYSTWTGKNLYLEDIVITEKYRNFGIGGLLFERCIAFGKEQKYSKMAWQVLDWNVHASRFYERYGTDFDNGWINCTLNL